MTFELIFSVLISLNFYKEDTSGPEKHAQMAGLAYFIAAEKLSKKETAFLIAWGEAETRYSLRIHAGNCLPHECGRGKARGPWQRESAVTPLGIESTPIQVKDAAAQVRWALRYCQGSELGAFRALRGCGCACPLPGEASRVARMREVLERLQRRWKPLW